jgi:hypothetical protein
VNYTPTWNEITGKPPLFSGSYVDLTDKPPEIELSTALESLGFYLGKTTAEINAIVPANGFGIAFDKTLNVYKVYANGWKILITSN